jgi:hypothetical protein
MKTVEEELGFKRFKAVPTEFGKADLIGFINANGEKRISLLFTRGDLRLHIPMNCDDDYNVNPELLRLSIWKMKDELKKRGIIK